MTHVTQRGGTGSLPPGRALRMSGYVPLTYVPRLSNAVRRLGVCALERQPKGQWCRTVLTLANADAVVPAVAGDRLGRSEPKYMHPVNRVPHRSSRRVHSRMSCTHSSDSIAV